MTSSRPRRRPPKLLPALAWQLLLAVVACAALVAWLLPSGAWGQVMAALAATDPLPVLAALAVYPLLPVVRARRLQIALGGSAASPSPGLWPMTWVAALHSVLASFAPMRLGELSLVWLLNRAAGTPLAAGSALLVALRMIDLVIVLAAGVLALALLPAARDAVPHGVTLAGGAAAAMLGGLLLAPWVAGRLRHLTPFGGAGRLARVWETLVQALAALTPGVLARLLAWTVAAWGLIFLMAWLCANSTPAPVGLAGGVAGGSATALASVLPVNTFANAGTFEAAWVLALMPAGLDEATALVTGIVFHAVNLLGSALLGGLAALIGPGRRAPETRPRDKQESEPGSAR
ncbi:lysylphosphatidylglycerol synthase transmembrane domain-containing protein [uncultured Rhodospira sp.]|uniref:lysylphosphatidylglycerol synthase transmembrane domain-containing protein n=1 Tax=uncultured Rhodospira sp. TaxID=1936189 RepID=UPI0026024AF2|nr:lysylphosphatidylglycerol synthase transmembrane domain-containing protein [uncultured Rhodospira sp.]